MAALVIILAGAFWYQQQAGRARAQFPAPEFALKDLQGRTLRLSDFRGKVVLLNVWATWCAPCRQEMPSMEILSRRMQGNDFVILAVSADDNGAVAVKPFVDELGLTFPILLDPENEVSRKFGVTGYPETFLIDRAGTVLLHHIGFQDWSDQRVFTMLKQVLAATPTAAPQSS